MHTLTHSFIPRGNNVSIANPPTGISLGCGRKLENLEEAQVNMGRTCTEKPYGIELETP